MKAKKKSAPPASIPPLELNQIGAGLRALATKGIASLSEAIVYTFVLESKDELTVNDIVKRLKMPFSTASRVVWALSQRELLTYSAHATDRRKKIIKAIA